jgi:hypothetical protein
MQFDGTITLGNILTILAMAGGFTAWFFRTDAKIQRLHDALEVVQRWIAAHEECSDKQEEILDDLRECVAYIKGQLGRPSRRKGAAS